MKKVAVLVILAMLLVMLAGCDFFDLENDQYRISKVATITPVPRPPSPYATVISASYKLGFLVDDPKAGTIKREGRCQRFETQIDIIATGMFKSNIYVCRPWVTKIVEGITLLTEKQYKEIESKFGFPYKDHLLTMTFKMHGGRHDGKKMVYEINEYGFAADFWKVAENPGKCWGYNTNWTDDKISEVFESDCPKE